MMKCPHIGTLAILLAGLVSAGCSGDDDDDGDGSSGDLSTGVPADKPLDQLTESEETQVCEALLDYFDSRNDQAQSVRFGCVASAYFLGVETVADCNEFVDECVLNSEPEPEEDECAPDADPVECSATVGEWEACVRASADNLSRVFSYSCEDVSAGRQPDFSLPPACEQLQSKCPDFFEGEE